MEYQINQTPYKITEILEKLFNLELFSDITFIIEDKFIYAHSVILMLRSSIFQTQLETTLGDKKIIPITDYGYDAFYQFIQFIYTDYVDVNVSGSDARHLLKLAKNYNVVRLVNHLLNINYFSTFFQHDLERFNSCLAGNTKIDLNSIKYEVADNLKAILDSKTFVSIHPDTIEGILKLEQIEKGVTESDIIDAIIRWMNHHCKDNQIHISECCRKFSHLIRLIRFPTLSNGKLRIIQAKYPELLTKSDFMNIASHKIYGAQYDEGIWNCTPRMEHKQKYYKFKEYSGESKFETKFSVNSDLILGGFVFGSKRHTSFGNITISSQHHDMYAVPQININDVCLTRWDAIISLGASIRVRPNVIYTIRYSFKQENKGDRYEYYARKSQYEIFVNAPSDTVKILKGDATMHEIWFFKP